MLPEQIAKALITESFHSRRLVVAIFVIVNAALLTAGWLWPKGYVASTSILVDERTIIQPLMQGAAVATGVAGIFMETHPNPAKALSDGPNAWPLHLMKSLLELLKSLDELVKSRGLAENALLPQPGR